jgi:hypothetical protein
MQCVRYVASAVACIVVFWTGQNARLFAADTPTEATPAALHDHLVDQYMKGEWKDLEKELTPPDKDLEKLTGPQRLDIKYIRDTMTECRPTWWRQCADNQEFNFRPTVWGRALRASFDPDAKSNINMTFNNNQASCSLHWETADMDNPAPAEHGFSKGDLSDFSVWSVIGEADSWTTVPLQLQINMKDPQKQQLQRFLEFNANLSAIYYGTPMARRWGVWLCCAAYLNKYAAMVTINSRKGVGAFFLDEVVAHRAKYPSVRIAEEVPDEKVEETLCIAMERYIEKHPWTLPEDRLLRDQVRAFYLLNQRQLMQSGVIKLPNGLAMALDPAADASNQGARDAWLKRNLPPAQK